MRLAVIAQLLGLFLLVSLPTLPPFNWIWFVLLILITFFSFIFRGLTIYCLIAFLSFTGGLYSAHRVLDWQLSDTLEGKPVFIKGIISSLPKNQEHWISFDMDVKEINHRTEKTHVRLNWMRPMTQLKVGDEWQLMAKLKKPHGMMNLGCFDEEKNLFLSGIRAKGYVVNHINNKLIVSSNIHYPIQRLRQFLQEHINAVLKDKPLGALIIALTVGSTSTLSKEEWDVFRNTGTSHLMAISGLHIGLVAGLSFKLVEFFWKRIPFLVIRFPAFQAASVGGLIIALIYSALAGFSVSTQRALIMISVIMVSKLLRRNISFLNTLFLALGFILIKTPFAILQISFWLSFLAVGYLIYGMMNRVAPSGLWWKWGRAQWVSGIGMIPFCFLFFQSAPLLSMPANLVAIPWVSFLVVPTSLLGVFCFLFSNDLAKDLLNSSEFLMRMIWPFLKSLSHQPIATWVSPVPSFVALMLMIVGTVFLLQPKGMPNRWMGFLWWLPCIFYPSLTPFYREVGLTLFDVGQGLASVVRTQHHTLIFDTGAKLSETFDMGQTVVVPYMRQMRIRYIDKMVISHGDNDHAGGAKSVLSALKVKQIYTSVPERFPLLITHTCLKGQQWEWDGVKFSFLYPFNVNENHGNNASCVLKIDTGEKSILLTGDIEKEAEELLVNHYGHQLSSTLLVVPHHGSHTSSTFSFLQAVHPLYALFSFGYRNHYHHPHKIVCDRYQHLNIISFDTVKSGAIDCKLTPKSIEISEFRKQHRHFWNF